MDNSTHYLDGSLTEITAPATPRSYPIQYAINAEELAVLQCALAEGAHVIVSGKARTGKTLLAEAIARRTGGQLFGEIRDSAHVTAFSAAMAAASSSIVSEIHAIEGQSVVRMQVIGGHLRVAAATLLEVHVDYMDYPVDKRRQLKIFEHNLAVREAA